MIHAPSQLPTDNSALVPRRDRPSQRPLAARLALQSEGPLPPHPFVFGGGELPQHLGSFLSLNDRAVIQGVSVSPFRRL